MAKTHVDWLELTNNSANPTDVDTTRGGLAIVDNTLKKYVSGSWAEVEAGTGSSTFVGLSDTPTNFTGDKNKVLKVNNAGDAVEFVTLSGDATIGAAGVVAIASGVIVNADIKSDAAIAWSKMASSDDIHTDGTVTDLSISASSGNVLRYDGSDWKTVDPSTLPGGTASGLAQSVTIEGGTYDLTLKTTSQTSSAADLTIPDFAGDNQSMVLTDLTQTLTNKTISADSNTITDIGGAEIEDIAGTNATYSVPITIVAVNSGAATTTIFDSNAPFKFRVIDAWAVSTKGDNSGTWNVNDGTDPIVSAVAYGTGDTDIARAAEIDDAKHEIAASGSLKIANSETADTGIIYVQILKITT